MNPMDWAFLDVRANENEKLQAIGEGAAWYWAMGILYCRRKERDRMEKGQRVDFIPHAAALALWKTVKFAAYVRAIVKATLWHEVEGGFVIHDYDKVYGVAGPAKRFAGRQLGGVARASKAQRDATGRYQKPVLLAQQRSQQRSQQNSLLAPAFHFAGPASRAPAGSGSLRSVSGSEIPEISKDQSSLSKDLTAETRARETSEPEQRQRPDFLKSFGKTAESEAPEAEQGAPLPADFESRFLLSGEAIDLASKLGAPLENVSAELRRFVLYWSAGLKAGQRRTEWPARARQWIIDKHTRGELRPPSEGPLRGRDDPSAPRITPEARQAMLDAGIDPATGRRVGR